MLSRFFPTFRPLISFPLPPPLHNARSAMRRRATLCCNAPLAFPSHPLISLPPPLPPPLFTTPQYDTLEGYTLLHEALLKHEAPFAVGNRLYYMSLPPTQVGAGRCEGAPMLQKAFW